VASPQERHSPRRRDFALRRLRLWTRGAIAGSIALFGALAAFVATTAPGRTTTPRTPLSESERAAESVGGSSSEARSEFESAGAPEAGSEAGVEEPTVVSGGS
jgi:hypothetical protein